MGLSRRSFLKTSSLLGIQATLFPHLLFAQHNTGTESENPYLDSPLYAPLDPDDEKFFEPEDLKIEGNIPDLIQGTYYRNGPNPRFRTHPHHWFDGDGMIHSVRICGKTAQASYRNRFVHTSAFKKEGDAVEKLYPGILETRTPDLVSALRIALTETLPSKDCSHTDVIYFNDRLISLNWLSGIPYELNPDTLETMGPMTIPGYPRRHMAAHARVDVRTGELFFLDFSKLSFSPWVTVSCLRPDGTLKWDRSFSLPQNRIFHDILFTENYVILMDFPVGFDIYQRKLALLSGYESRIVLISRTDGQPQCEFFKPAQEAPYVLHGMNAYEDENTIILTACKYLESPFAVSDTGLHGQKIPFVGPLRIETRPVRWKLYFENSRRGIWEEEAPEYFHHNTEFPRVNDRWLGRRGSRYTYHPVLTESSYIGFQSMVKYDWLSGTYKTLSLRNSGGNRFCEEFVFIPKENETAEDDGYLASMVHTLEGSTVHSAFEIYDASSLEFAASIKFPRRVPVGFHGKWVAKLS